MEKCKILSYIEYFYIGVYMEHNYLRFLMYTEVKMIDLIDFTCWNETLLPEVFSYMKKHQSSR
jgi:hypothetical protein